MNYRFIIQAPYWFYILALVVAIAYAWLLYSKKYTWSKPINWSLAVVRTLQVFMILFIISAPLLKQSRQDIDKPVIAVLLDNSSSIAAHTKNLPEVIKSINESQKAKSEQQDWVFYLLNQKVNTDSLSFIKFNNSKTNIQAAIKNVEEELEGQKIAALAILSDGNYNQGINPNFIDYKYPVYTLGLGDTTSKRDLSITGVQHNKIAYLGNKFIINYKLKNSAFVGENVTVTLKEKEKAVYGKDFKITRNKEEQTGSITLEAKQEGMLHYVLTCSQKEGEFTFSNNEIHIYIEVVKNKEKILILAQAPHPDVKAISAALNSGQNYEVEVHFVGDNQNVSFENVNAAVLVGIPNKKGLGNEVYNEVLRRKVPAFYVLQSNTDYNKVNNARALTINIRSFDSDKAQASLNERFESFGIGEMDKELIAQFPPLNVPFANYTLNANSEVLLYQKIGSSVTLNPLWVLGKNAEQKTAIVLGDGLWMWRINEKSKTQASTTFDEMVIKTVQFIASKADKRKFKVITNNQEYEEGDLVTVDTEIYDDLNQLTYGHEIGLVLKDESNKEFRYKYVNQESSDKFEVGQFAQGSYHYTATTQIAGKNLSYSGVFNVKKLQLEDLTSVADHQLLKDLSLKTKGAYFEKAQVKQLMERLSSLKSQGKVRLSESYSDLINIKWLFIALLVLISLEWFLRKYFGSY